MVLLSHNREMKSFNEAFVEFFSHWHLNATTVDSETAVEIENNFQTNVKYNICQITNTITKMNLKQQTNAKHDWLPQCHLKCMEKDLKVQNAKEQILIIDCSTCTTIPEQFLSASFEKKHENQNKTPVRLSSNC